MKQFEVITKGKLRILSSDEIELREVLSVESAPSTHEEGYKSAVGECHKILDQLNIPSAKGISCPDPECNSALGHRLRDLRDKYLTQQTLLSAIGISLKEATNQEAFEFEVRQLLEGTKSH